MKTLLAAAVRECHRLLAEGKDKPRPNTRLGKRGDEENVL